MNILIVDDDAATLELLARSISKWGYDVTRAGNGRQACGHLENGGIDIVVSDWMMPEMNGLELCQKARAMDLRRYIYFIMISAKDTDVDVVRGLQGGVDDYITKPLNLDELKARIEIGTRIICLERELNQKFLTIKRNYYQSVQMFTSLLESYNKALGGHARRVAELALTLAKKHPQVQQEDYPVVEAAARLHDIGLIGLSETLITKSLPEMTGDEKKDYLTHPERGELILSQVDLLRPVAKIVRMHHEQPNGRGFPDGLDEKQIPPNAAAVGAASIYDHLAHIKKIPFEKIPEMLQQYRGYQLSSDWVDLLLEINLDKMSEEAKRTCRQVAIDDLKAGMILANDIHMRTGAFVMGAGTCIDTEVIGKLKKYHELGNISRHLYIEK